MMTVININSIFVCLFFYYKIKSISYVYIEGNSTFYIFRLRDYYADKYLFLNLSMALI